jgi:cell division septation protein DedD
MSITTQQLAELLIGVARSQQAIIDAVDSMKAGFKGTHLSPALDSVAKIRSTGRALTLQDYPARILLQCQGRAGPNLEQIIKDLDDLLAGKMAMPSSVAPATARAAAAAVHAPAPSAAPPAASAPAAKPPAAPAPAAKPPAAAVASAAPAPKPAPADNDLDMT